MPRRALAMVVLFASGCSSPTDSVVKSWKSDGHTVGVFKSAAKVLAGGKKCSAGTAAGFDVTLCEFEAAEAAKAAEEAGFELVKGAVGTSVAAGTMVLVIADTRKEDPSGKKLNALVKSFRDKMN